MSPQSINNGNREHCSGHPRSINNGNREHWLGIIIHLDAHVYKLAWQKLYGNPRQYNPLPKLADPTITKAYHDAKHKIMLNELYGVRGFPALEPKPTYNQVTNALQASIAGIQAFYTAIGNAMIPTMERMTASFTHFAQNLNQWANNPLDIRSPSQETIDTILAMAPEEPEQTHDRP